MCIRDRDYWVVYSASVAAIGLCVLAAAQGLTEGHWEFFWSMLGICSVTEPLLCYMLWRKTLSRKFKNRSREITLSNLEMARTLYRIRERHRKEQL